MADIIPGINPTRMELIKLRRKIKLAKKGRKLLKEKRDALIMRFMEIIKEGGSMREAVEDFVMGAYRKLVSAEAMMGTLAVRSSSMAVSEVGAIGLKTKNLIGTKVPEVTFPEGKRDISSRGYSPIQSTAMLDEATRNFEDTLQKVLKLAEVEKSIYLLAEEVEKTKRRVNALDYIIVPRMENTANFIKMRLEEMEREDFSRLKKIKSKLRG